ncbi:PD-(D/E)XK nuclease family protein [Halosimplex pelagicum]|uniref:PD-(D/E)XK nuclease family protein n=1 Tax=Halosimplex pelagicum TaxID=869886 RepID=A0A7D5PBL6_9EURY|nr:PD-(D/E)XK nuclease family protein [Halosimplex pelagicum]QLH83844.1 PD-(D/E)XK nuclease family protein [Halosimplex pelagicum]
MASKVDLNELENRLREINPDPVQPKTSLEIIGRARYEDYWTEMLGYFLDPTQPHGLDDRILIPVLQEIAGTVPDKLPDSATERKPGATVTVETQVSMYDAADDDNPPRIDLGIWAEEEWFVLIEIKVGASESGTQTQTYYECSHFSDSHIPKTDFQSKNYVYLALDEHTAPTANGPNEFQVVTWRTIQEVLDDQLPNLYLDTPSETSLQLTEFKRLLDNVLEPLSGQEYDRIFNQAKLYTEYPDIVKQTAPQSATPETRSQHSEEFAELSQFYDAELNSVYNAPRRFMQAERDKWITKFEKYNPELASDWRLETPDTGNPMIARPWWHLSDGGHLHFQHSLFRDEVHDDYEIDTFNPDELQFEFHLHSRDQEACEQFRQKFSDKMDESDLVKETIPRQANKKQWQSQSSSKFTQEYIHACYELDEFDQEGYYNTLATAVKDHEPFANAVDEVCEETFRAMDDHYEISDIFNDEPPWADGITY